MIIIATHTVFINNKDIYGPPHAISLYLNKKKIEHIFIKHRLYSDGPTLIEFFKNGKLAKTEQKQFSKNTVIRYAQEVMFNVKRSTLYSNIDVFIGVDPLNTLSGNILKFQHKTKRSIYFSADFALKRFDNPIMNGMYHTLDQLAMRWCDQTWSVSKRITHYRKQKGLSHDKNLLMPNAPFVNEITRTETYNIHDLVLVSALEKGIDFTLLINAIDDIRRRIPDIRLILIGGGSKEQELKDYVKGLQLNKHVVFKGPMSHDNMFKVLVNSGVGIALYDNYEPTHFRYFSDPMKVRDYLASGLPVLVSGNSAIGEELEKEKAGYVVKLEKDDIIEKLESLFKNKKQYDEKRRNALKLAKKYDTYQLLENYL